MSTERQWLVKSSDSILGPFEFDRVVENIFSGEIHLLDEIKGPFERWRPIKDHSLFAAAIEKLKASTYQQKEMTETHTVDIHTNTDIHTHTEEMSRAQTQSITEKVETTHVTPTPMPQPPKAEKEPPKDQVIYQSKVVQQPRISQGSRFPSVFLFSFLILVLGSGVFLVYEFQKNKVFEEKVSQYDQLTDGALRAIKLGEYQTALKHFNQAYSISPNDPNLIIEMTPLSVQFDGQFSQAKLLVEKVLSKSPQKTFTKHGRNVIGLSYAYQGKYQDAVTSYEKVLSLDDQFLPAHINKAYSLIKLGRTQDAVVHMRMVVTEFPNEAIAHYLYIRSLVEHGVAINEVNLFREAISVASQFSQNFADLVLLILMH